MDKTIDNLWKILETQNEWIKFSETKAGIIITVYGIGLTVVYTNANDIYNALSNSPWLILLTSISVLLSVISLYFSFVCINPNLKNKNPSSIIYFGHIKEKFSNFSEYHKTSSEIIADDKKFELQVAEQVYVNSIVAWKKFKNVSYSIRAFAASILFIIINLLIYFIE